MITYYDFLAHVVNLTTRNKYVCLMHGQHLAPEMEQQVDAQLQTHEDRLGRFYHFFVTPRLNRIDLGTFDFVKDYLFGLGTTHGSSGDALARLTEYLGCVDFIAIQIGTLGAKFLVAINGDRQSTSSLTRVAESLNGIGNALLELQGAWKLKVVGMKLGKGIGLDVTGSAMFAFEDGAKLGEMKPSLDQLQLGTSQGERFKKALKSSFLNPLLFGQKGSINLSLLIFRLFDQSVEVPGFWRSLTAKVGAVDRFYFGFTPEELLPAPRQV